MDNRITFTLIGAAIATALIFIFFWPSIEERTEISYKTDTVTVYDTLDVTNIVDSIRWKEKTVYREVSPDTDKYDSIRTYQGFEKHLYGRINWTAKTGGYLQHLEINPVLTIPIQTVTNTIEKKTSVVIKPKGVYFTGGINSEFKYSIGGIYLNDKSLFGYEYTPQLQLHEIKAGFKVF